MREVRNKRVGVGIREGFINEMIFEWGDEEWVRFLRVETDDKKHEMWIVEVTQVFFFFKFIHKTLIQVL